MKKFILNLFTLSMILVSFISCEKENEMTGVNVISFTGEFVIGNKTYTNPTFDLGDPKEHIAYLLPQYSEKNSSSYFIKMEPWNIIYLPNDIKFNYNFNIYTDKIGTAESDGYINIFSINNEDEEIWLNGSFTTTITKIEDIDGYIEGTYTGSFYPSNKKENPITIDGIFKVKRTRPY